MLQLTLVMYVILILASTFVHFVFGSNTDEGYFRVFDNMRSVGESAPKIVFSRSETECAVQCKRYMKCCIAEYTRSTKECVLDISDSCNYGPNAANGTSVLITDMPCVMPPVVSNATFTANKVVSSGKVQIKYTCNHDDILVTGDSERECTQGPLWSGKAPVCKSDFTFSETQNTWYKLFSCACFGVDTIRICKSHNAQVIYINSLARQQFLETVLHGKEGFYLIDGNDYDRDNVFTQSNGALMTYFNFANGEPSRGPDGENCLAADAHDNFKWHDLVCGREHQLSGVVCEIPP